MAGVRLLGAVEMNYPVNKPNMNTSQRTLSRRDFFSLMARLSIGTALLPTLTACSSSNNVYEEQAKLIWEQPIKKQSGMNNELLEILHYATLAPSGHNTQPWKFSIRDNTIRIFPDYTRRLPIVDPDDRELFISLGCALENLVIAARQMGYDSDITYFPADEPESILVRLDGTMTKNDIVLFDAIPQRQSTRNEYNKQSVPATDLKKLENMSNDKGVSARLFTDAKQIEPLIEYVKAGDTRQYGDKAFVEELVRWIRFNDDEAIKYRDGLSTRCTGNPTVPRWLGSFFMSISGAGSQAQTDEKNIRSSAGMMLLVSDRNDKQSWIDSGRAYQRFTLMATALNIKSAFMNQAVEIPELRSQLQSYLDLGGSYPQLLLRFGYSQAMPRSLRRPLEQVLV